MYPEEQSLRLWKRKREREGRKGLSGEEREPRFRGT